MAGNPNIIVLDLAMSVHPSEVQLRKNIQLELDHSTSRLRAVIAHFKYAYRDEINDWFQPNLHLELNYALRIIGYANTMGIDVQTTPFLRSLSTCLFRTDYHQQLRLSQRLENLATNTEPGDRTQIQKEYVNAWWLQPPAVENVCTSEGQTRSRGVWKRQLEEAGLLKEYEPTPPKKCSIECIARQGRLKTFAEFCAAHMKSLRAQVVTLLQQCTQRLELIQILRARVAELNRGLRVDDIEAIAGFGPQVQLLTRLEDNDNDAFAEDSDGHDNYVMPAPLGVEELSEHGFTDSDSDD